MSVSVCVCVCVCVGVLGLSRGQDKEMISCVHVSFPFSLTKRIAVVRVNEV